MNLLPIHAPHYNRDFVIIPNTPAESSHPFVFIFHALSLVNASKCKDRSHFFVGNLIGDYTTDEAFAAKLRKWHGILNIKFPQGWTQGVSRLNEKEYKRLSTEQKKQKALTKLSNRYSQLTDNIKKSGSLFIAEELAAAGKQFEAAQKTLIYNYDTGFKHHKTQQKP